LKRTKISISYFKIYCLLIYLGGIVIGADLPTGHGLSQAKPRPSQGQSIWLWLGKSQAKAMKSQAKAMVSRPSQAITSLAMPKPEDGCCKMLRTA
jgi:hypothetical protein